MTLKTGVYDAVVCYNKGALGKLYIMKALGLKCSENCSVRLQQIDRKRILKAERKIQDDQRKKRQVMRQTKRKKEEKETTKDYDPGMF